MNAQRRKLLEKADGLISDARGLLEEARQDEQEDLDSLEWEFQETGRSEEMPFFLMPACSCTFTSPDASTGMVAVNS